MADFAAAQAGVVVAQGAGGPGGQADVGQGVQLQNAPAPVLERGVIPQAPLPAA